ncbi:1-deoxy-D-xylulose-5-phosphate reductoisomerase [Candidatus Peregrinibacteria bacterium]|jgi:1-deoxy-D-xylulose-5-phosphate reductoisomerase|nr:1-deoxy-D-xylulose-5-phosphate reductoisomerase [Candidatus Peregrinibacteria bacterium]MBT4148034.1 1-deoxy-D-xylulose-5-phosphate reductoisomerase [Candidatus Peregrinibacteria bacterium]MBT4366062.1 1-deoxy-D-xylulose-5-phosphate reductoisomerase [Candidatus Peregrinibacteria bacterium]MBT4455565.1 1-deoxy-D-xylulose-5-phosphate reductoisomerase [Candidatus Peregrinibacteria bacterium]
MKKINVIVLGSTGSVGTQTLAVLKKHKKKFNLVGISGYSNKDLLNKQAKAFKITKANTILAKLIKNPKADIVVNAISGSAGLNPSKQILSTGKTLALANKESVILGGKALMDLAKKHNAQILPLDSEHHAILRILQTKSLTKYSPKHVRKITLTCSGGPFYGYKTAQLKKVTPKDALKNPNWDMGPKILIESATLLNKGFELIEAHHLFSCPLKKLDAVIDRKSYTHAMVEFQPKERIALAYKPDMKIVIEDTLLDYYHETNGTKFKNRHLKFLSGKKLATHPFKKINHRTFPAITRILKAHKQGKISSFYKKSEKNIKEFLSNKRGFTEI